VTQSIVRRSMQEVWSHFVEVESTYNKCNTPYAKDCADVHTASAI